MNMFVFPWHYLGALAALPWLYTVWHIWRGEFPGRLEKRRLIQQVLYLPVIGLWQYWTHSVQRRMVHHRPPLLRH